MIAACFAPMARCHARQSSRNAPALAERRAVASSMMSDRRRCEQQDCCPLGTTNSRNAAGIVARSDMACHRVDDHAGMDGRSLRDKRPRLWPHALSLHRTVFSWHGRPGDRSHCRLAAARQPTLADARHPHCGTAGLPDEPNALGSRNGAKMADDLDATTAIKTAMLPPCAAVSRWIRRERTRLFIGGINNCVRAHTLHAIAGADRARWL